MSGGNQYEAAATFLFACSMKTTPLFCAAWLIARLRRSFSPLYMGRRDFGDTCVAIVYSLNASLALRSARKCDCNFWRKTLRGCRQKPCNWTDNDCRCRTEYVGHRQMGSDTSPCVGNRFSRFCGADCLGFVRAYPNRLSCRADVRRRLATQGFGDLPRHER